jgi:CubicO group peptidase (beta-lactamase class C family)
MDLQKIKNYVKTGLQNQVFPGCGIGIFNKGQKYSFVDGYVSHKKNKKINQNTLFDLASLSKPLATALACFVLIKDGKFNLETTLELLLGCSVPDDKKNITLSQVLSHSAGFTDHCKFYKKLEKQPSYLRKNILLQDILQMPLSNPPGTKVIYSDIGFILLFLIIEHQSEESLDNFVYNRVFAPMDIQDICYVPKQKGYTDFASTENCMWRKKELNGDVHDQNTYILDGVSGQSGLFGSVDSVLSLVVFIKDIIQNKKTHPYLDTSLLKDAVTRRVLPRSTCWGLGFDTPSQPGSSAGQFISENSCGHLGFTGTSFWIDFDRDIVAVLLTNRINPTVDNLKIRDFRPLFHDLVFG